MLTMQIGIVLAVILAVAGVVQWRVQSSRREKQKYILEYAEKVTDLETRKKEAEIPGILSGFHDHPRVCLRGMLRYLCRRTQKTGSCGTGSHFDVWKASFRQGVYLLY